MFVQISILSISWEARLDGGICDVSDKRVVVGVARFEGGLGCGECCVLEKLWEWDRNVEWKS